MFSVIINIYNKKTKGPTLMELFTATRKLFFYNYRCSVCAPRVTRHTSIRYSSSCHTHTHTRQRVNAIFCTAVMIPAFTSARSRGNCRTNTLHEMHVAQWPQTYTCDIPKHRTTSPPERPFSHHIRSHRLVAELWTRMKNNLLGKKNLWFVLSICTCFVNTCPTVFL
jgi:hypothetical protein